jgi:hypothetical protein
MAEHPIEIRRRAEWERIRATGLPTFLLVRGVLLRGIPMALAVMLLLVVLQGDSFDRATLLDPAFLARLGVATLLFSLGGMLSAYARWRALDARFHDDQA